MHTAAHRALDRLPDLLTWFSPHRKPGLPRLTLRPKSPDHQHKALPSNQQSWGVPSRPRHYGSLKSSDARQQTRNPHRNARGVSPAYRKPTTTEPLFAHRRGPDKPRISQVCNWFPDGQTRRGRASAPRYLGGELSLPPAQVSGHCHQR